MKHKEIARKVIAIEANAVKELVDAIDESFDIAVEAILKSKGRVIVCGMGKSGIIGKKISATLASTGTPSFSMHPGEAFHGDLGMIHPEDTFLALSYSGETEEVLRLLPFLKDNNNFIISLTGNPNSTLARESNLHLNVYVKEEACPLKLAPTSSTTATLVMGDAIALTIMEARDFKPENFAKFHPGGSLGRKLLCKVRDDMITSQLPIAKPNTSVLDLIEVISSGEQGIAVITSGTDEVIGLVTDGDLRRAIETFKNDIFNKTASDIMSKKPKTIGEMELASHGRAIMEEQKLNKLLVTKNNKLIGILRK